MIGLKKMFDIRYLLLLVFLMPAACDKVDPPYMTGQESAGDNGEQNRKVLLEVFTGHTCPNCPPGSRQAAELKEHYGDRLIVLSIHAGWFAGTIDDVFSYDFRTDAGEALYDHFGVTNNPVGMVSRRPFEGSTLLSLAAWAPAISQLVDQQPGFLIDINTGFEPGQEALDVEVSVEAAQSLEEQYHLSVFLKENEIIKPQRTNDPDYPSGIIHDYSHQYVLRKSLNGTWGDAVNQQPMDSGDRYSNSYSVNLEDNWDPENMAVVAFVYETGSMEVLQAEKKDLLP